MFKERKIFLFPGCFDPFHLQHQEIITFLFKNFVFDELWILINRRSEEKKIIASFNVRKKIIALNLEKNLYRTKIKIHPTPIGYYTTTLVKKLKRKNPHLQFFLVLGSDQINSLPLWKRTKNILDLVKFVAIPRQGYPKNLAIIKKFAVLWNDNININNINSKEIKLGYRWKNLTLTTRNYLWKHQIYTENILKNQLSIKRFQHLKRVAELTRKIKFKTTKQKKIDLYLAGLWHDLTKEWSRQKHLQFLQKHNLSKTLLTSKHFAIWHGVTTKIFLEKEMLVQNQEILFAIEHHSSGHPEFKSFDKALFVCDKLERNKKDDPFFKLAQKIFTSKKNDLSLIFEATLKCVVKKINANNFQIGEDLKQTLKKFIKP